MALLAAMSVLTASAGAAPAWLGPSNLTGFANSMTAVAADSDAKGDVVAGWVQYDGTNYSVEVATRTAGGAFHVTPVQTGTGFASNVAIGVNDRGDAIVAWRRNNATSEIWATTRSRLGGFATPQAIASVPGANVNEPSVAVADNGAMMVVWWLSAATQTIYGAYRSPGGSFQTTPISSSDTWNQSPRVALDATGRATIVWSYWNGASTGDANNFARVRVRAPEGTLGTQRDLSTGAPTGYPMFATVGLDHSGNAIAVWSHWNGSSYDVTGATRGAGSDNWNNLPVFGQSAGASFGNEPQVAVDAAGDAVAVWRGADATLQASSRAAGGSFGQPQTGISQPSAVGPRVALDRSGTATAIWLRTDPDGWRVEAATRPLGGGFGAVRPLSGATSASNPALAVDGVGNAFTLWPYADTTKSGNNNQVQYAVRDVSPPTISIGGASVGTVGQALALTASTFDVWGPVTTAWSLGDGGTATGASVGHAYGAAGDYAVTATATDRAGNHASQSRTIHVANPAPPSGGTPGGTPPPPPPAVPKIVGAKLATAWTVKGAKLTLTELTFKKLPKGWTAKVLCSGKKCPFTSKKLRNKTVKSGTWKALKALGKKHTFHAGQTLEVRIGAPGRSTKVVRFALKKGKTPKPTALCLPPGAKKPATACS